MVAAPTEFKLPQDKLDKLLAVTLWYDMMPSEDVGLCAGDSFHENVNEFQMSHIPDHPFFANGYTSHLEIRDGIVYAALCRESSVAEQTSDDSEYIYVPFVAE